MGDELNEFTTKSGLTLTIKHVDGINKNGRPIWTEFLGFHRQR